MRWIILAFVAAFIVAMVIGVFPREGAFFVMGFLLFVVLFLPLEQAFWVTVVTIPLSPALPVAGFDTLAMWRFLVIALFLRWLWQGTAFRPAAVKSLGRLLLQSWTGRLFVAFIVWAGISLLWASDAMFGLRQLLFLINVALLFPVVYWVARVHRSEVISAVLVAVGIVVGVGYFQWALTSTFILAQFWVYWSQSVIPVFFGGVLGDLLLVSNTWFAYFANDTATLRMFSLLPDSHSFALFVVLGSSVVGSMVLKAQTTKWRFIWFAALIALLMAIILSGTRGLWVTFPVLLLGMVLLWLLARRRFVEEQRNRLRMGLLVALSASVLFVVLFPLSGPLLAIPSEGDGDGIDAFRRARSSFDLSELSVRGRIEIWEATWSSVLRRPLHGVGYGNFGVVLEEDATFARFGASAHNLYFNIIAETGIIGGILAIGWLLMIVWKATKSWLDGYLSVAFPLVFLWVLAYGFFDVVLLNDRVALLFVVLLGLTMATKKAPHMRGSVEMR